jgi:hypothetical protein
MHAPEDGSRNFLFTAARTSHSWREKIINDSLLKNGLYLQWPIVSEIMYLLTYLLTKSIEQSTSWEGNRFSANQEISRFSWNRRFITAFTSVRHVSLSWATSIQSIRNHVLLILQQQLNTCSNIFVSTVQLVCSNVLVSAVMHLYLKWII